MSWLPTGRSRWMELLGGAMFAVGRLVAAIRLPVKNALAGSQTLPSGRYGGR